jgi:hypothetical protein
MRDDERNHLALRVPCPCFHFTVPLDLYAQQMTILIPDISIGSPRGNSSGGIDIQSALNGSSKQNTKYSRVRDVP